MRCVWGGGGGGGGGGTCLVTCLVLSDTDGVVQAQGQGATVGALRSVAVDVVNDNTQINGHG